MNNLERALDYAERGWKIFPVEPHGKKPICKNGYKDATCDVTQIREWWSKAQYANIGLAMEPNGLMAVDVDPRHDGDKTLKELEERYGELPDTIFAHTGGNGKHYIYKCDQELPGTLGPGVDIKYNGYIVVEPSLHPSGRQYVWDDDYHPNYTVAAKVPDWIVGLKNEGRSEITGFDPDNWYASVRAIVCSDINRGYTDEEILAKVPLWTMDGYGEDETREEVLGFIRSWRAKTGKYPAVINNEEVHDVSGGGSTALAPIADYVEIRSGGSNSRNNIALAVAEQHQHGMRYDHKKGAWYVCKDGIWREDTGQLAFNQIRMECVGRDPDNITLGSDTTIMGVEKLVKRDQRITISADSWNADPNLAAFPGGYVDLGVGHIHPADPTKNFSKAWSVVPAEGAHPNWSRFLTSVTGGDKELEEYLQVMCGYFLTGHTREHAVFFAYGGGGNGKSVFQNVLSEITASYAKQAAIDTFMASKYDKHPTGLASMVGSRLVMASETEEGRQWAESTLKQLSGGDPITARFMGKDEFTYKPQFKLFIVGNHKPLLRSVDDSHKRRFHLIPFVHKPKEPDLKLPDKLREEYPQIANWMIQGATKWYRQGLNKAEIIVKETDEYFEDQDFFSEWLETRCATGTHQPSTLTVELLADYNEFARMNGFNWTMNARNFGSKMRGRGFSKADNIGPKRLKGWENIRLIGNDTWITDNDEEIPF